jgi:NitT/TauT family transport system ATP-binding protein
MYGAVAALGPSNGQADGLSVLGVSKRYKSSSGPIVALEPLDLVIARGSFVTLLGPSGCGKSTLLRIIAGLSPADAGTISIFGESVERARHHKNIGFVPQSLALLPWRSVLENVELNVPSTDVVDSNPPMR